MKNVTARQSNPFGFDPGCDSFVPGYGDANADFHVIGDHPGIHGGAESGYPFTGFAASERLQAALADAGLLTTTGTPPTVDNTYFSYLHMCVPDGVPSDQSYADLKSFFDAELRAITAHILLPVGERATRHVFSIATSEDPDTVNMDERHATEISGSGWLVVPIKDPAAWSDDDEQRLVATITDVRSRDYRQRADLGRFLPGDEPYLVR